MSFVKRCRFGMTPDLCNPNVRCLSGLMAWAAMLALGFAPAAHAQDRPNGFYLTTPLELSSGYDNGFVSGSRVMSDSITIVGGPTFSFIDNTHRTDLSINYQPDFEIFSHYSNLDSWDHSAIIRLTHRINSRWSIEAGNSFIDTTDPNRALMNSLVLLPRALYLENDSYFGVGYRLDHATKLQVRFDNSVNIVDLTGPLQGRLNLDSSAGTLTVDHTFSQKQSLSGDFSFLHVMPMHPELSGPAANVELVNLVYSYSLQRNLMLRLSGGGVEALQPAATGAVEVEKAFGNVWAAAGYQRYVGFFGGLTPAGGLPETVSFTSGVTPDAIYDVVSARIWGQVTDRLGVELTGQRALNGVTAQGQGIKSVIGHARFNYKLNDRLSLFVEGNYYGQNVNRFLGEPLSETRVFAGIQVTLARPPQKDGQQAKHSKAPQDSPKDVQEPVDGTTGNPQLAPGQENDK